MAEPHRLRAVAADDWPPFEVNGRLNEQYVAKLVSLGIPRDWVIEAYEEWRRERRRG